MQDKNGNWGSEITVDNEQLAIKWLNHKVGIYV